MNPSCQCLPKLLSAITCLSLLLLAGCTRSDGIVRCEVRGVVTVDGGPLKTGQVALVPLEGTAGPSVGAEIVGGRFHIGEKQGPVPGRYQVQISANRPTGRQVAAGEGADDPEMLTSEIEQFIPEKYNSQSELTVEVQPTGTNKLQFELKLAEE